MSCILFLILSDTISFFSKIICATSGCYVQFPDNKGCCWCCYSDNAFWYTGKSMKCGFPLHELGHFVISWHACIYIYSVYILVLGLFLSLLLDNMFFMNWATLMSHCIYLSRFWSFCHWYDFFHCALCCHIIFLFHNMVKSTPSVPKKFTSGKAISICPT